MDWPVVLQSALALFILGFAVISGIGLAAILVDRVYDKLNGR